jgi:cell wall-associated NlpC family hydrolase
MTRIKLFIIGFAFLVACAIHPDPRYTRSRPATPRKENKISTRKNTSRRTINPNTENSTQNSQLQNDSRKRFALEIQRFIGAPYVWGGASPAGTDCSGLIRTVYRRALGVELPHSTHELYDYGDPISEDDLRLGDLVFFSEPYRSSISHVGIYLDQGKFVHASLSEGVTLSDLNSSWYIDNFEGARRILKDDMFE